MLKNLKHSILFILMAVTILLVVATSLAASKPIRIDAATVNIQKENNLKTGTWSGLGMCVSATSDNLYQLSDFFGDQIDDLLASGITNIRTGLFNWNSDTAIAREKLALLEIVSRGGNAIAGVTSGAVTLTSSNWTAYHNKVIELAAWAQANGIYEFIIGNEEQAHNDDTTLTDTQLRANLRALATDVQAVFTRGNVTYACIGDGPRIDPWIAEGKGDLDLIAFNSYRGGTVFGNSWKSVVDNMVAAFGDSTYITEFSVSGTSLASWSSDEAVQASGISEMLDYYKTAGIKRALFYEYYDDPRPWNPPGFGVLKTNRTYRLLWNTLTSENVEPATASPNIALSPSSKSFGSVDTSSNTNPSQTFTITNTGSGNLIVGTIALTGTDAVQFTKSNDSTSGQTIAAGVSKTITITFDPSSVGSKNATLSIPSNDPDSPTLTAGLSGTATASPDTTLSISNTGNTITLIPDITEISPELASGLSSSDSNTITITGTAFGSKRSSSSYILFADGIRVSSKDKKKVPTWTDTMIRVKVPSSAVSGDVVVVNSSGTSAGYAIEVDSIAPDVSSITINDNDLTTTSEAVSLSIEVSDSDIAGMQFANSSKGPWSSLEPYKGKKNGWILSSGPGTKPVYVKVLDNAGNYALRSDTITLIPDITEISPELASGLSSSDSNTITITGTAFGSKRSSSSYILFADGIRVSSKDKKKVPTWTDTMIRVKVPSSAVSGDVVVVNSSGTSAGYAIEVDSIAPDVSSITINDNDLTTTSEAVSLSIEVSDSDIAGMQFANSSKGPWSSLEPYKGKKNGWILSSGPGTKPVYVKVLDNAGNYALRSDTITLIPDITEISPELASGLSSSDSNTITITGTAFGSKRSSSSYILFADGIRVSSKDKKKVPTWTDTMIRVKVPSSAVSGDVVVVNSSGTSAGYGLTIGEPDTADFMIYDDDSLTNTDVIMPDETSPQASIVINNDDAATDSRDVTLNLLASDDKSDLGSLSIRYRNDSGDWSEWENYPGSNQKSWTLSELEGNKTVYIQVKDEAGNTTDGYDSINYENTGSPDDQSDDAYNYVSDILDSINNARLGEGLSSLSLDNTLCNIAEDRSSDMIEREYFSHTTPDGQNLLDILEANSVAYSAAAENIAYISPPSSASPDLFFNNWMDSGDHRDNILNSDFTKIGISISSDDERIIAVLIFIKEL